MPNVPQISKFNSNGNHLKTVVFRRSGTWVATFTYSPVKKPIAIQWALKDTENNAFYFF